MYLENVLKEKNINLDSITKQLSLLVMVRLYEDTEDQKNGVTVNNITTALAENRELWYEVGRVTENKDYRKRIAWVLSTLVDIDALKVSDAMYYQGSKFETVLKELIYYVSEQINLEMDFSCYSHEQAVGINSKKGLLPFMIEQGNMELSVQDYERDKKIHLFTWDQLTKIAKLGIELGVYEYLV